MKLRHLFEKRKNPEMNPRKGFTDVMNARLEGAPELPTEDTKNAFVSFTSIDKLGINPSSTYNTPIGVYAYPLQYVKDEIGEGSTTKLPFAGGMPYANFFSLKSDANIISSELSRAQMNRYLEKLIKLVGNDAVSEALDNTHETFDKSTTPFGILWGVLYHLSVEYPNSAVRWNKLFREIGIDAAIDEGSGTIHDNEPTQIVVFNTSIIEDVDRIKNVGHSEIAQAKRGLEKAFRSKDPEEITEWLIDIATKKINFKPSPRIIYSLLEYDPTLLKYYELPPEYDLKIIQNYPQAIDHVKWIDKLDIQDAIDHGLMKNLLLSRRAARLIFIDYSSGLIKLNENDLSLLVGKATAILAAMPDDIFEYGIQALSRMCKDGTSNILVSRMAGILVGGLKDQELYDFVSDTLPYAKVEDAEINALVGAIIKKRKIDFNYPNLNLIQAILLKFIEMSKSTQGNISKAIAIVANTAFPYDDLRVSRKVGEEMVTSVSNENLVNLIGAVSYRNIVSPEYIAKVIKSRGMNISDVLPKIEQVLGDAAPIYTSLAKLA